MSVVKLSAPWAIYYKEVQAMFREDQEIQVLYDEEACELKIYVTNDAKAAALATLLPSEKTWGNVTLKINVIPANGNAMATAVDIASAFQNNPALLYYQTIRIGMNDLTFFVFKREVVQYFTDDASDIHGLCSTLYQDIAKRIFGDVPGVCFNTANEFEQYGG